MNERHGRREQGYCFLARDRFFFNRKILCLNYDGFPSRQRMMFLSSVGKSISFNSDFYRYSIQQVIHSILSQCSRLLFFFAYFYSYFAFLIVYTLIRFIVNATNSNLYVLQTGLVYTNGCSQDKHILLLLNFLMYSARCRRGILKSSPLAR